MAAMQRDTLGRLRFRVRGAVQGVGFRPFIYRLAVELGLSGWVSNSVEGVEIEVEGSQRQLNEFVDRVETYPPPNAIIMSTIQDWIVPQGDSGFQILQSDSLGEKTALILPDIATCSDCLREIFDPADRRFRYPFTNCTNCGPRFSIINALPYDRANTTMRGFVMCDECRAEYEDPLNRRFHAQPNACPNCGPHLELWDPNGVVLAAHDEALLEACKAVRSGRVLALKGLGGFQLIVNASDRESIARLRKFKLRREKAFALMAPTLGSAESLCEVSRLERKSLMSSAAPIVLLRRKEAVDGVDSSVAPDNPYLGVMLPYTPLHHLMMAELGAPVIATSGNLADEPICIEEREALSRLAGIADVFLVHNRPIARHVDDSVVQVMAGSEVMIRRARGYAPLPLKLSGNSSPVIAVGGQQKNTIAVSCNSDAFVSQHIGDLETILSNEAMRDAVDALTGMYEIKPKRVVCDLHADYASSQYASELGLKKVGVQHHYAHALACMAENKLEAPVLAVVWDGSGLGTDKTVWGGEFLKIGDRTFDRVAHLRTFMLPGNERAVLEPRRSAAGLLFELYGDELFDRRNLRPLETFESAELANLRKMLANSINSPVTSSAGRLFDAVASIVGAFHVTTFEAQAAMKLQFLAEKSDTDEKYNIDLNRADAAIVLDWKPMIESILGELEDSVPIDVISAKFHNGLVDAIVTISEEIGEENVVLTGGCFQNKYLIEKAVEKLVNAGFKVHRHRLFPPNDGSLALGQIAAAFRQESIG